jgi:hypothetical protein
MIIELLELIVIVLIIIEIVELYHHERAVNQQEKNIAKHIDICSSICQQWNSIFLKWKSILKLLRNYCRARNIEVLFIKIAKWL